MGTHSKRKHREHIGKNLQKNWCIIIYFNSYYCTCILSQISSHFRLKTGHRNEREYFQQCFFNEWFSGIIFYDFWIK